MNTINALPINALPINDLPIELINKIINYTNVVTFYNGKYYNRIMKNDKRYTMLESIIKTPHTVDTPRVTKSTISLKKNIGESYNTPRYKLTYLSYKNNVGEYTKELLVLYKCGREESYYQYYILSKECKWMKTCINMHQDNFY
jgi:hypothetical protein